MPAGDADEEKTTELRSDHLDRTVADDSTVADEPAARRVPRTEPPDPLEPPSAPTPEAPLEGGDTADPIAAFVKPRRRRWRWVAWFFGVLFLVVAVSAVVVAIYWDPIIRAIIVARAKQHGIDLAFDAVEVHRDHLVFTNAKVHASELSDVALRVDRMAVALDGAFAPTSVTMSGLHVAISDAPGVTIEAHDATAEIADFEPRKIALEGVDVEAESAQALLGFARVGLTPPLVSVAPSVTTLHVELTHVSAAWPLPLGIDAASIAMSAGSATFRWLKTTIPLVDVPVSLESVSIAHDNGAFTVHVPEAPYVELSLDEHATTLHIVLSKVPADLLAAKLHWSRPPGFALSATADLNLPKGEKGDPTGTFDATLDHYEPPHPIELNGIVFGDATKGHGAFTIRGAEADLTDLHLDAGDLHMSGTGKAVAADGGKITLSLDGVVPCSELASSAVGAHLGLAAGFITGEITRDHLGGNVEVKLGVVIEGKKASQPEIHPAAFLHCVVAL